MPELSFFSITALRFLLIWQPWRQKCHHTYFDILTYFVSIVVAVPATSMTTQDKMVFGSIFHSLNLLMLFLAEKSWSFLLVGLASARLPDYLTTILYSSIYTDLWMMSLRQRSDKAFLRSKQLHQNFMWETYPHLTSWTEIRLPRYECSKISWERRCHSKSSSLASL